MALTKTQAVEQVNLMLEWRRTDLKRLNRLYQYIHGRQPFLWLPENVPDEVRRIAEMSRVNVLGLVVDSVAQSMYIDGYRVPKGEEEAPAWDIWQRNKLDARQLGVHRSALGYGAAYTVVLPGDPVAVVRGISPRNMTTVYGEDDDWPVWALERRQSAAANKTLFRLFDDDMTYWVSVPSTTTILDPTHRAPWDVYGVETYAGAAEFISAEEHGVGHVPVVRFLSKSDLDEEVTSEVDDLIPLQDQIDLTTFALLVVQHYGAFPQKWITGWAAETDAEEVKVGASKILTFEDPETKLGAFVAADLTNYIDSRRDALRNLASISQTPAHALRGELVNLSAEALAAAEQAERRKVTERETMYGEAWEQTLALAASIGGLDSDPAAQVRWKDTEARAFAATVDALGKMATMLQIPVQELWERVPGATQADVERWKATAATGDSLANLTKMLDQQMTGAVPPPVPPVAPVAA